MENFHFQKILILFSILFLPINCYPQEYQEMDFTNGIWIEEYFVKEGTIAKIQHYCTNDTLIGDNLYYKLHELRIERNPPGYYPDTLAQKFLGLIGNFPDKTVRYIPDGEDNPIKIYDYNLDIGDTIKILHDYFVIREIDSVNICGKYHKKYSEYIGEYLDENNLIEGIGYSTGVLGYFYLFYLGDLYNRLICYSEWSNPQCSSCNLIDNIVTNTVGIRIYPNPFTSELYIESKIPVIQLNVMNFLGRPVYSESFKHSTFLNLRLENLPSGFYILKVQFSNGTTYSTTVVKN